MIKVQYGRNSLSLYRNYFIAALVFAHAQFILQHTRERVHLIIHLVFMELFFLILALNFVRVIKKHYELEFDEVEIRKPSSRTSIRWDEVEALRRIVRLMSGYVIVSKSGEKLAFLDTFENTDLLLRRLAELGLLPDPSTDPIHRKAKIWGFKRHAVLALPILALIGSMLSILLKGP